MEANICKYCVAIKALIIFLSLLEDANSTKNTSKKFHMLMPNVRPLKNSTSLCKAVKMPEDDYQYIIEFRPSFSDVPPHYIGILACSLPGQWKAGEPDHIWDCGGRIQFESGFNAGPMCQGSRLFLYEWTRNALHFKLPQGVGFKVGKGTNFNYLVLQVHYSNVNKFLKGGTDNSGVILTIMPSSTKEITKSAGSYLLSFKGLILPGEEEHEEIGCKIEENIVMHPFAFRPHAQDLGAMVSGYKIDKSGKWHLIGKHNPLDPEKFYPVVNKNLTIEYGDFVAGRFGYYNYHNHTVNVGPTANDEMYYFYMMYYVEGDKLLNSNVCHGGN